MEEKIGGDKIRRFLARGELIGVNVAANLCGRPQWRLTPESVAQFEMRRTSNPAPRRTVRRRGRRETKDYYPDPD